jgi:hypothetical protein
VQTLISPARASKLFVAVPDPLNGWSFPAAVKDVATLSEASPLQSLLGAMLNMS